MQQARSWGFKVSDAMTRLNSLEAVDAYINHWDKARKELPVATDGLVFKVDSLRQQLNLGTTAKSPRWYRLQISGGESPHAAALRIVRGGTHRRHHSGSQS